MLSIISTPQIDCLHVAREALLAEAEAVRLAAEFKKSAKPTTNDSR